MSAAPALPRTLRVIVRDWLNANQAVLADAESCVVIDSGYVRDAARTLALLDAPGMLDRRRIDLLVNTLCHSDHMGGNAALARAHRCRIGVPQGEAPLIRRWDERELWLSYADQRCERFTPDDELQAGARYRWGGLDWLAVAAPGHDMHALMFWCERHGVLISGDALWEHGFGLLLPGPDRRERLESTRATLDTIAALAPRVVVPGHGRPFGDVDAALARARARLAALAEDELRMVRAVLKTMFMFTLLEREAMARDALPDYFARTGLYADLNRDYFGLPAARLADLVVDELQRAGAVELAGGVLRPRTG